MPVAQREFCQEVSDDAESEASPLEIAPGETAGA